MTQTARKSGAILHHNDGDFTQILSRAIPDLLGNEF